MWEQEKQLQLARLHYLMEAMGISGNYTITAGQTTTADITAT